MVDLVSKTTTNDNDDWEVAVDTGQFDKQLEQQEKARSVNQEPVMPLIPSPVNVDDTGTSSGVNFMNLNKPIRILRRPTSQSQLLTNNDGTNSAVTTSTTATSTMTTLTNTNNTNNSNSTSCNNSSTSTTVPAVSIIPRNQNKDATNSSQSITTPVFSSIPTPSQATKPAIKTYEQREAEYRLARLRIMGEEESSAKDDDDDTPIVDSPSVPVDDTVKSAAPLTSSSTVPTRTTTKINGLSQTPLQCHSTPGSYASNLYAVNNGPPNTGTIHFTPNTTTNIHNSTASLGTGPFSSPNFPQHYRGAYSAPYSHMPPPPPPPPPPAPCYPLSATSTATFYMTSTAPFVSAPSSSSVSSSYHYPPQQHVNLTTNNWRHYQHSQTPYRAQQFGHPQ